MACEENIILNLSNFLLNQDVRNVFNISVMLCEIVLQVFEAIMCLQHDCWAVCVVRVFIFTQNFQVLRSVKHCALSVLYK